MSTNMTGAASAEPEIEDEFGIIEGIVCGMALLFLLFWVAFIFGAVTLAVIRVATRLF
jgi:hypothetical protein